MSYLHTDLNTPWGNIASVIRAADETVVGAAFGTLSDLVAKAGHQLNFETIRTVSRIQFLTEATINWIDGDPQAFNHLKFEQAGGKFSQACWSALQTIAFGEVITYSELATMAQSPNAVRAAGSACANNSIAPFIPCHRVVKTDGVLGNYGFGSELKHALLIHEGVEF